MGLLLLALAGCCDCPGGVFKPPELYLPGGLTFGDELVLDILAQEPSGDWLDPDAPGALLEVRIGTNVRHVLLPGGIGPITQSVSLGRWEGGDLSWEMVRSSSPWNVAGSIRVDPAAAGTPVLGTYDDAWWNDSPLVVYEEDGLWTWVFTDEDGGTGLLPTLLMASWGRPVDIEGLWDETPGTIQTTDHAWVPFDGPYEGTHPLFEVVTYNGLIGPLTAASEGGAPYLLSPIPVPFDTAGGTLPREQILDEEPWVLATSWAEAEREGLVVADGGQDDYAIGAPDDYLFLDYEVSGGARVSFEAEVDGAWWSSLNGLGTSGLTDATVSGLGRTCVELPPGASAADVTALRVRSHGGVGTVSTRSFHYADPDTFAPVEHGLASEVSVPDGGTATLFP